MSSLSAKRARTASTAARGRGPSPALLPVWRVLTSVRFAVFYIAALAVVGLLGVLIPQIPEAMRGNSIAVNAWVEAQRDTFGPLTTPMHRAGLFNVFASRWFIFGLGFLVINVTVCTFNRWSPTFRNIFTPPRRVPDTFFESAHNRTVLAPVAATDAEATLRALRFRVQRDDEDGATYLFADRYPWSQLATFISHMALILFIAGGFVTVTTGFHTAIFTGEGTTAPVFAVSDPRQLQVRVDDAVGTFGEQGNPLDFRTHLTIFRNGEEVASGTATVNDPVKYGGYRFHQVGYLGDGAALRIRDVATGDTIFRETFPLDQATAAPVITITDASGNELLADTIAPTLFPSAAASGSLVAVPGSDRILFVGIVPKDEDAWRLALFDAQGAGSGTQVLVEEGEEGAIGRLRVRFDGVAAIPSSLGVAVPVSDTPVLAQLTEDEAGTKVLLLSEDDRPTISLPPGEPVINNGFEYTFEGPREFAGIEVRRDRGAWFIWIATGMLLAGLALNFYVPRRRLWLKLTPERTQVAALAEKSGGFPKEMRRLARRLGVPVPPDIEEER